MPSGSVLRSWIRLIIEPHLSHQFRSCMPTSSTRVPPRLYANDPNGSWVTPREAQPPRNTAPDGRTGGRVGATEPQGGRSRALGNGAKDAHAP